MILFKNISNTYKQDNFFFFLKKKKTNFSFQEPACECGLSLYQIDFRSFEVKGEKKLKIFFFF